MHQPEITDKALLQRLTEGDVSAFEELYRRYLYPLYEAAFRRLKDRQRAEDLVQDIFFRLWNKRQDMQAVDNLGAYLHTAVRYEVLKRVSRQPGAIHFFEPFEEMLAAAESPEDQLVAKELLDLIYKFAATLPEKRRQIFLLHIGSRLSTREIAETLDVSQKTVQNQLGTALNGLRTHISPALAILLSSWL